MSPCVRYDEDLKLKKYLLTLSWREGARPQCISVCDIIVSISVAHVFPLRLQMESFFSVILFVALWGINPGLGGEAPSLHSLLECCDLTYAAVTSAPFKNASISCYSGGVNVLYDGYSTNPALQCECITQFENWYHTTNPPTRTLERTIGVGSETKTITSKGSTTTSVIASLTTYTVTVTGNFGGADGFDWYGSAKSPCVS